MDTYASIAGLFLAPPGCLASANAVDGRSQMTQLHLDADEWESILLVLRADLERVKENPHPGNEHYTKYMESIVDKIDIALNAAFD
jgi:hypothetical protein